MTQVTELFAQPGVPQLLQLRNGAHARDWSGPFSRTSERWNEYPAAVKAVGFHPDKPGVDDGSFWMTPEDFCANVSAYVLF